MTAADAAPPTDRVDTLRSVLDAQPGRRLVTGQVLDVLNEHPLLHLDTDILNLLLDALQTLLAGDEPDESALECQAWSLLWDELDTRSALSPGGLPIDTGWPHKGMVILEAPELHCLIATAAHGMLTAPVGHPAHTDAGQRAYASAVTEFNRVLSGIWDGFPPASGHQHPGPETVLGASVIADPAQTLRGGLDAAHGELAAVAQIIGYDPAEIAPGDEMSLGQATEDLLTALRGERDAARSVWARVDAVDAEVGVFNAEYVAGGSPPIGEREVTVTLRFSGCDRTEANAIAKAIAQVAIAHTDHVADATVETDPVCECGHPASRHEIEARGDTRCLIVAAREDLVDVFDDGRVTPHGMCGCPRFRRRR